jgi:tetratricopeptide (TPR) repeat protein
VAGFVLAADPPPPDQAAQAAYQDARKRVQQATGDPAAAWRLGRACFDWAEYATNDAGRAERAREGIRACEQAVALNPDLAPAHYYLAMNQGQLARTMSVGALHLVQQMETHFLKARELDAQFDEAGPDRNLGLLYLQAPGWPVCVGSRSKARAHLSKAVKLAPDYPENRLNLMEAHVRWKDNRAVRQELEAWDAHVDAARGRFSGDRWHWDWLTWEQRLEAVKQRLRDSATPHQTHKQRG